jgi:hypothetical protein
MIYSLVVCGFCTGMATNIAINATLDKHWEYQWPSFLVCAVGAAVTFLGYFIV